MKRIKGIITNVRKFFYLKENERPDYMSDEEINRPLTKEQEEKCPFPREFAKTVAQILG